MSARSIGRAEGVDPVRALQRVLYRVAKSDRGRRFHALYAHVARSDVLWRAWNDVRSNQGAPGIDGITVVGVEDTREGEQRQLGIPTVGDRVVMTAAKIVLELVFEADFLPVSHGVPAETFCS